jgi:hypothetical protein
MDMDQATRKRMLSLDTLRVETFEPQTSVDPRVFAPPTAQFNTFPPCCSEKYVCA